MTAPTQINGRRAERPRAARPPRGYDAMDPTALSIAGMLMCCACCSLIPNTAKAARRHYDSVHLRLDHPAREDSP